jgi:uncharacterized membrane protein YccC
MKTTMQKIKEKIIDFSWTYPRASLFILGVLTGLLLAFIF